MRTLKLSLQIMVKYQPSYLFLLLAAGLAEAAKPFVAVLLPKLVLEELSGARDPARLLLLMIAAAGFSGLIYWLSGYLSLRRDRANAKFNNLTDRVLADRTLTMDYPYLEDPEVLKMVQQFMQGRMTQGGLAGAGWALGNGLPALLTALGMLFILARLSGGLLGLLLAATAVSLVLLRLQVKYLSGMTMEMADGNRILSYLFSIFTDFSYGKDIRLFEAEPLMTTRMKDTVDELWRVCFGNYTKSGACQAGTCGDCAGRCRADLRDAGGADRAKGAFHCRFCDADGGGGELCLVRHDRCDVGDEFLRSAKDGRALRGIIHELAAGAFAGQRTCARINGGGRRGVRPCVLHLSKSGGTHAQGPLLHHQKRRAAGGGR